MVNAEEHVEKLVEEVRQEASLAKVKVKPNVSDKKSGRKYLLVDHEVDEFTVKRVRKLVTPSLCTECGYDVCDKFKFPPYDELKKPLQEKVERLLALHKEKIHPRGSGKLVDEEDIVGEWFS